MGRKRYYERGTHPNSLANLKPMAPGQTGNPTGINGHMKAGARFGAVLRCVDALEELRDEELRQETLEHIARQIMDGALEVATRDGRAVFLLIRTLWRE